MKEFAHKTMIHPTAIIHKKGEVDSTVTVGTIRGAVI